MKLNKYFVFMLILICSLIYISGTNSPIGIRNLEQVNDVKRKLDEQTDNYIIIEFGIDISYGGGKFLLNKYDYYTPLDYNKYISYIINEREKIYPNSSFTAKKKTKLEVHFNQPIKSLYSFFNVRYDDNYKSLILGDFRHFDTSSVTEMLDMFYGCSSLQALYLSNINTSSVTNMMYMFYQCSSLKTLDLSNFDTSSVTTMSYMFSTCTSLKYLIISNFNFNNIQNPGGIYEVSDIFYNLDNLEYIDIYNIKDFNGVLKKEVDKLNNKYNLTVCQNNTVVINNQNAIYNCCNIIDDILVCNNIQTTIPLIQTTIPQIQTTIPMIQTTIPQIQKDIPMIQTTIPLIQTTIPQIKTTVLQTQIASPEIRSEETILILLGFNSFKLSFSTISFNILFTKILNDIYSNLMKVIVIINYNERIRILEEKEIDCYLKKKQNTNIASYFCEIDIKNSNIKQVKINPKFNFINQTNISIIGSTPFARLFMNNLQDIEDKYDNLENSFVYILDHSVYTKYSTYKYNISGIIEQEPKSKLEDNNINLMINLESESKIITESGCNINKINKGSYALNCELKENINGDLQNAISFINDDEILLINFGNGNSTIIKNNYYKKYISKTSSLKAGAIVGLILSIIFVLAALIGTIIYLRNKKLDDKNKSYSQPESIGNLKLNKI